MGEGDRQQLVATYVADYSLPHFPSCEILIPFNCLLPGVTGAVAGYRVGLPGHPLHPERLPEHHHQGGQRTGTGSKQ